MHASEAIEAVNALRYRPGWKFEALALPDWEAEMLGLPQSTILVRMECATVDTDREYAIHGYPEPRTLSDVTPLDASSFADADALLFEIFGAVVRLELHESREFFRCADRDMNAPFHPHRPEGELLWDRLTEAMYTQAN